ncbi:hypothetical protein W911_00440 [Hyphomicrobium nitrativorans NL23]|uniref:Polyketide synthase-like methyltransferase domain-containing protein n=1 Tax=Hyphomicrobium nitrativorans NL23 TaxID=1029756 RepID=V5SIP2_9HYPH|nr:class I SAM-dependent methyltransferase [Hyphomicrobium nitrativorans]AHB49794.1 hypothetical protein W911_00440 [Hyphomicrobium nitrativorans NL23]
MRIFEPGLIARLKSVSQRLLKTAPRGKKPEAETSAVEEYWTGHNVTLHRKFSSAKESLDDFHWRNDQYFGYIELMPVSGADGLAVLDFGCGPGYDLVGFATQSKPSRLVGVDVSRSSLAEACDRLALHSSDVELLHHDVSDDNLPLDDASMDLVHSSGVLHHVPDIDRTLAELRRVLKPDGAAQFMVYHADSLWVHLYVAYERQIVQGIDAALSLPEAFRKSTDGADCPISRCYTHAQFVELAARHGFALESFGVAVSAWEMSLLHKRFAAIMDQRLPPESRRFLAGLTFDGQQLPLARPRIHAGIDGCYRFRPV